MNHFTIQDWTIFFMGISSLIAAVVAGMLKVLAAIKEIHLSINSRMDQFLDEARKSSLAEGRDQMRQMTGQASTPHPREGPPVVQVESIVAKEITAERLNAPAEENE